MTTPATTQKTLNVLQNVSKSFKAAKEHYPDTTMAGIAVANIIDSLSVTKNAVPATENTNHLRQNLTHLSRQLSGETANKFGPANREYDVTSRPTKRLCKNAARQLLAIANKL